MASRTVKLDESRAIGNLEVKAEPLVCELDELTLVTPVADAAAAVLRESVRKIGERAVEGNRLFNVTGRLARGIHAVGGAVLPPPDRLQTTELLDRFVAAVPDPADDRRVKAAQDASDALVSGTKGGSR
jgi:hypothetical protein